MRNGLVVIKGAGDLATGVAVRLYNAGFGVCMTEIANPTSIRRTVCFSEAVVHGSATVECIKAVRVNSALDAASATSSGNIAVIVDEVGQSIRQLEPIAVVDAIIAKRNLGTTILDARVVVALGPGFTAGVDCHAVIETSRGHDLGRVIYVGGAVPNTGVPGSIGGYSSERLLKAPCAGTVVTVSSIGDIVEAGETVAFIGDTPIVAQIGGVLRGILPGGAVVTKGMKSGDIDPRGVVAHCYTVSDKARAIAGGVLEAIMHLSA